jgi:hypothetical protein
MDEFCQDVVAGAAPPGLRGTYKTFRNPAWLFCALTFGISWTVWTYLSRLNTSPGNALPFLTTEITPRGVLLIVGNLAPGIVAMMLHPLIKSPETSRFRDQFKFRGCSADVYVFAITCPVLIYMVVLWTEGGITDGD